MTHSLNSCMKTSRPRFDTEANTHIKSSSCQSWLRNLSPSSIPSFEYNIFISFKWYLWVQWERPLELCLHHHSGSHQRADSVPQFLPPPLHSTADPWCRLRFLVGRSSGSLCLTHTADQILGQLPGNTGVLGCYCIEDNNLVIIADKNGPFLTMQLNSPLMVLIYP